MRFPGATGAFALFGEVLLVGLLVTVGGILLVTLPAALAAGIRHLRRYLNAEASPQRQFWRDYLKALPGGLVVGVAGLLLVLLLILDIDLAELRCAPGRHRGRGRRMGRPRRRRRRAARRRGRLDSRSRLASRAARGVPHHCAPTSPALSSSPPRRCSSCVVTWVLVPLVIPALGCAALAVVAIPARRRRR